MAAEREQIRGAVARLEDGREPGDGARIRRAVGEHPAVERDGAIGVAQALFGDGRRLVEALALGLGAERQRRRVDEDGHRAVVIALGLGEPHQRADRVRGEILGARIAVTEGVRDLGQQALQDGPRQRSVAEHVDRHARRLVERSEGVLARAGERQQRRDQGPPGRPPLHAGEHLQGLDLLPGAEKDGLGRRRVVAPVAVPAGHGAEELRGEGPWEPSVVTSVVTGIGAHRRRERLRGRVPVRGLGGLGEDGEDPRIGLAARPRGRDQRRGGDVPARALAVRRGAHRGDGDVEARAREIQRGEVGREGAGGVAQAVLQQRAALVVQLRRPRGGGSARTAAPSAAAAASQ